MDAIFNLRRKGSHWMYTFCNLLVWLLSLIFMFSEYKNDSGSDYGIHTHGTHAKYGD